MDEAVSTYTFRCGACSKDHDRDLTREQFIQLEARCPHCQHPKCRRVVAIPDGALAAGAIAAERQGRKYPFVSSRLPFRLDGAQHEGSVGRNVVTSKRHYAELCKAAGFKPGQG